MNIAKAAGLALVLVSGMAALAFFALRSGGPPPVVVAAKKDVPAAPAVKASEERTVSCRVVARETVTAGTALSGVVESVLVDIGQTVADGQVLANIGTGAAQSLVPQPWAGAMELMMAKKQAESLQANVTRERLKFKQAESVFRRQELLNREGATPRLVYESALAERDRLAAELAAEEEASRLADNAVAKLQDQQREATARNRDAVAALANAANAEIHAPAAGLIVERNIAPGETITEANRTALFRIAPRPDLLRAEFDVLPALERIAIHVGDANVSAAVSDDGKFADFESRTVPVHPGSPCTVTLRIK